MVGEVDGHLDALFDEENGHFTGLRQFGEGRHQLLADDGGEAFERFVEKQHPWLAENGAGGGEHLLFAARKLRAEIAAALFEARKQRVGFLDGRFRPGLETDEEIFLDGEGGKHIPRLRHVAEAGFGAGGARKGGDVLPADADIAGEAFRLAGQRGEEAGLADAVAAENRETRARRHGKRQALDDAGRTITGGEVDDFKRRCGHRRNFPDRLGGLPHCW